MGQSARTVCMEQTIDEETVSHTREKNTLQGKPLYKMRYILEGTAKKMITGTFSDHR